MVYLLGRNGEVETLVANFPSPVSGEEAAITQRIVQAMLQHEPGLTGL